MDMVQAPCIKKLLRQWHRACPDIVARVSSVCASNGAMFGWRFSLEDRLVIQRLSSMLRGELDVGAYYRLVALGSSVALSEPIEVWLRGGNPITQYIDVSGVSAIFDEVGANPVFDLIMRVPQSARSKLSLYRLWEHADTAGYNVVDFIDNLSMIIGRVAVANGSRPRAWYRDINSWGTSDPAERAILEFALLEPGMVLGRCPAVPPGERIGSIVMREACNEYGAQRPKTLADALAACCANMSRAADVEILCRAGYGTVGICLDKNAYARRGGTDLLDNYYQSPVTPDDAMWVVGHETERGVVWSEGTANGSVASLVLYSTVHEWAL